MIEDQGAIARVSSGYSVKIPGGAPYSSEDSHASLSVEFTLGDGQNFDELLAQLETVEARLNTIVKAHVYAALGMEFDENATSGVLSPVWPAGQQPAAKRQSPQGGASGGQTRTAPKVQNADKLTIVLDGVPWYDQRPLKADNRYAPGASDFKAVNKEGDSFPQMWLRDKDGELDARTTEVLDRNEIAYS